MSDDVLEQSVVFANSGPGTPPLDEAMDVLKGKRPGNWTHAKLVVALEVIESYQADVREGIRVGWLRPGYCQGPFYRRMIELLCAKPLRGEQ